ncbi:CheR family methyltransferase, partial [Caballeronia sp. LZ024]|uniref:CheR family methyltransferase n=1 Tax=Caballeronia sp. LZ024 TaxID=3038561 RepID=UPI00285875E1
MSDAIAGQPEPRSADSTVRPASSLPFPVVGIGASAGGVRALLQFFENAPTDMGMAFVVVLHLSPDHVSSADEVLRRVTGMPVLQVVQPVLIEKNHVYVIAPGKSLAMTDGYLRVADSKRSAGSPVTIDRFFRSLADAHGPHAMCLVLSGSGSDGAVGLSRIKEQGGITLAQLPADAEYAQMPQSAIDTGQVDLVLPVTEMPQKLLELWSNARTISIPGIATSEMPKDPDAPSTAEVQHRRGDDSQSAEECLQEILSVLRARTGHDFRHYKRATMLRRIERRLQVNAVPSLRLYRDLLRRQPAETSALLSDMLIGVTNFFRDREAFERLQSEVVPGLFFGKKESQSVRAWVAGVSSGEEAYSIAMLLEQYAQRHHSSAPIQVFATDIDERALGRARAGSYPDSIATDVPVELLQQFLTRQGERYVIVKSLREKVLFAVHNVLRDPPFARLDLVSCRNLLIYLDRIVQRQVLEMFHFALCPEGYLFLGTSESADAADDLFAVVDKKNRIYRAKPVSMAVRPRIMRLVEPKPIVPIPEPQRRDPVRHELSPGALHQRVLEEYAPPSIIVDRESTIVHMSDSAGRFLHYSGGSPTTNVIAAALPDLRLDLRTALFKATRSGRSVEARRVSLLRGGQRSYVHITVRPFHDTTVNAEFALILFDEVQETLDAADGKGASEEDASVMAQLEQELQRSKQHLNETIEQYETTLEEMKAGNEELQAINEELRSTTEELESSKEELQSINEELFTVNSELQTRIEDASKANDDLQNFISASDIATLFVDKTMKIKRFTSNATG